LALAGLCATLAAWSAGSPWLVAFSACLGFVAAAALGVRYIHQPTHNHSKWIERLSALWMLLLYATLALLPIL
jgi:hypothetical protein